MKQVILEDLPYEDRIRYIEELNRRKQKDSEFNSTLNQGSNRYEITQDMQLMVLKQPLTHIKTKAEWEVLLKSNAGYLEAEVNVLNEDKELSSGWDELFNLMKKLTIPLQKVKLRISAKGNILNVLNQKEIKASWDEVRKEYIDDPNFGEIIKLGDTDYVNSLTTIRKNILYQLFFFNLFKKEYVIDKPSIVESNIILQSVIFSEYNSQVDIKEQIYQRLNDCIYFKQYTEEKENNPKETRKLYKEKYEQFIEQNTGNKGVVDYSINYKSNYKVHEETGKLIHCKAIFEEKVNENLFYKSNMEIKSIN